MPDLEGLNDLGMPVLAHWVSEPCHAVAPGDWVVDEVTDVTCPACLKWFEMIRDRQRDMQEPKKGWLAKCLNLNSN
jgi:hypothetical protein